MGAEFDEDDPEYDDNPEWDESNSRPPNVSDKLKVIRAKLMSTQADFAALLGIRSPRCRTGSSAAPSRTPWRRH